LAAGGNLDKNIPVIVLEVSRPSVDVEYMEQFLITTMDEWDSPHWGLPYTWIPPTRHNIYQKYSPPSGQVCDSRGNFVA
jgi:hypothetical protein